MFDVREIVVVVVVAAAAAFCQTTISQISNN